MVRVTLNKIRRVITSFSYVKVYMASASGIITACSRTNIKNQARSTLPKPTKQESKKQEQEKL
jgi:hypothetical protein